VLETALRRGEIEKDGPWLRLPAHRAALTPEQERMFGAAKKLIEAARFCPPRTRDLATALRVPEPVMRATLKRVTRAGRLVEVAHDHFFLRAAVAELIAIAADLGGMGALSAAAFRDRLGIGRKVAIQILEFFDRAGVTRRDGDDRIVIRGRMDLFGAASDGA
jgi:selenocysteine-specific elongation factor